MSGYRAWMYTTGKSGKTHRMDLIKYTAGSIAHDKHYAILANLHRFLKLIVLDIKLSGYLPEYIDLRIVTREQGIINALRVGKCKSMIMSTILEECCEKIRCFKTWSAQLPPERPSKSKAA